MLPLQMLGQIIRSDTNKITLVTVQDLVLLGHDAMLLEEVILEGGICAETLRTDVT